MGRQKPALIISRGASKVTSSLITQIRAEKIGLNAFLHNRQVPGYTAPCNCGWPRQTAKHILWFCPEHYDPSFTVRQARAGVAKISSTSQSVSFCSQVWPTILTSQFSFC